MAVIIKKTKSKQQIIQKWQNRANQKNVSHKKQPLQHTDDSTKKYSQLSMVDSHLQFAICFLDCCCFPPSSFTYCNHHNKTVKKNGKLATIFSFLCVYEHESQLDGGLLCFILHNDKKKRVQKALSIE